MKTLLASIVTVWLLVACSSKPTVPARTPPPTDPVGKTGADVAQAVTTPLSDLNLVNAPIPPVLLEAQRAPYGEPADGTCAGITTQVHALDAVLGPDLDVPPQPGNPGLIERGAGFAGQAAT